LSVRSDLLYSDYFVCRGSTLGYRLLSSFLPTYLRIVVIVVVYLTTLFQHLNLFKKLRASWIERTFADNIALWTHGGKWPEIASVKSILDRRGDRWAALTEYRKKCADMLSSRLCRTCPDITHTLFENGLGNSTTTLLSLS
jgi:hypothetical protein